MGKETPPVTVKKTEWGNKYTIGGTSKDGEVVAPEAAADIVKRFEHEQTLFSNLKIKPKTK